MSKIFTAIGLMSGTSMDGVDAAVIRTDGEGFIERPIANWAGETVPYSCLDRDIIEMAMKKISNGKALGEGPRWCSLAEGRVTDMHMKAVARVLDGRHLHLADTLGTIFEAMEIDVIGFHGQTVLHRPDEGLTIQLGDAQKLADETGITVVADLRQADIKAGGQGAPLVPVYHHALVRQAGLELPVAVLNVGGVANVTYIGADGELIAFDTGPGNALIDDWVKRHDAGDMDKGGEIAAKGRIKESVLAKLLNNPFFSQDLPKSLDRNHFSLAPLRGMSLEGGAMTLTSFTALAASRADFFFPAPAKKWVICGGGVHNPVLMKEFQRHLSGEVLSADELGWSSDYMEAEAFAYLAVRSMKGLPLTFPGTTGVMQPLTGGVLHQPQG